MTWLSFFFGYFTGTFVTFLIIYFGFRIGESRRAEEDWREINEIEKDVEKEMDQLREIRDDKV
ncbi:hypothetical protein [Bacillus sp. XF8]|uniref:hypothetical protein n=1 Tax=Bacillus sp. XF8 TaxID=2819289 RepID=UPI001AA0A292|nr:hypothetical protein [Bacillus sp. XF8]MBO1583236.1 hypothetical protein [Bacillus sp. XF8]